MKSHLYWAMRNCDGNGDNLKSLIDNIPSHYQVCPVFCTISIIHLTNFQGDHSYWHASSACQMWRHTPSKVELKDPPAVQLLQKTLRETYIYHYVQEFCQVSVIGGSYKGETWDIPKKNMNFNTVLFWLAKQAHTAS